MIDRSFARLEKLVALATHPKTPEQEARTAAMSAAYLLRDLLPPLKTLTTFATDWSRWLVKNRKALASRGIVVP